MSSEKQMPQFDQISTSEDNALLRAACMRRKKLVRMLIDGGADINIRNELGQSALILAIISDRNDSLSTDRDKMVRYLLEQGINPDLRDKEGCTGLIHACKRGYIDIARLLLRVEADMFIKDKKGMTAIDHSANIGNKKLLKLLANTCKDIGKEVVIVQCGDGNSALLKKSRSDKFIVNDEPLIFEVGFDSEDDDEGSMSPLLRRQSFSGDGRSTSDPQSLSIQGRAISVENTAERDIGKELTSSISPSVKSTPYRSPVNKTKMLVRRNTTDNMRLSPIERKSGSLSQSINGSLTRFPLNMDSSFRSPSDSSLSQNQNALCNLTELSIDISDESLPTESASSRNKTKGPGGRMLQRQGSATKLMDHISMTRPGTLPPISARGTKPIPSIGITETAEVEEDEQVMNKRDHVIGRFEHAFRESNKS